MFEKLLEVEIKFDELGLELQNPSIVNDPKRYAKLMKEYSNLQKVVSVYREYKSICYQVDSNKELLETEKDEDLRALAKEDLAQLEPQKEELERRIKLILLPKNPNDEKNIILEIRAGAGGDEASLFAEELFTGYVKYAADLGWKTEILSISQGNVGGFKEVCASISGDKVYSRLKYESGVHRVQRVPKTENQGRIHTSTITVAVLPEAEEVEVKVDPNEIRIDVCRASGAGGQSVNTTDSAVRVTHIPTGTMVYCQEGKSQHSNRDKAMKILYSRLLALEEERARKEASDTRLAQIGTGDRSERIRTYNFPQSRVTDHRIGFTTHALAEIMDGNLSHVIDPVVAYFQAEALKKQE